MSKERMPRKIKKKIPKDTVYCYVYDEKKNRKNKELGSYYIKPCGFYEYLDGLEGRCKLCNCGVTDQVKSCSLRYPKWAK